ncbi:hypothetical protein L9Z41_13820 [Leptospira noguchii]|uniref:DUF6580 family putative transport protein n=1 Tax=Leptospira noguchii TaxID=28182 RepID=UPI001F07076A|nr:DUF6580 family putative transport protein [Leptospira noguchii]MCH1912944.1 hypothetical protein [Leptospira noguchii]MCH1916680.1 hypothetical protein [Leptospira noguchii]UOG63972.1 hypothetical protein MAL04_17715 [Leptospira noguchii]
MYKFNSVLRHIKFKLASDNTISMLGVIIAGISRFLPHPANFTSIEAMTVYSGARLQSWKAFVYPMFMLFVTDFILSQIHGFAWFYDGLPLVYCSILINVILGRFFLKENNKLLPVLGVSLVASIQFFFISNFSVWAFSSLYPKTIEGLSTCYIAALPYFGGTLFGNLIYTPVLFGVLDRVERKIKANFKNSIIKTEEEFLFEPKPTFYKTTKQN